MPYINQEDREQYQDIIKKAVEQLKGKPIGHLNYMISTILWKLFDINPGYTYGNSLIGALSCIAREFYRRKLSLYEDQKIESNGDIQ